MLTNEAVAQIAESLDKGLNKELAGPHPNKPFGFVLILLPLGVAQPNIHFAHNGLTVPDIVKLLRFQADMIEQGQGGAAGGLAVDAQVIKPN